MPGQPNVYDFGNRFNWDTDTVPGSTDDVVIPDFAGTDLIKSSASRTVRSITSHELVQSTTGIFTVQQESHFYAGLRISGGTFTANANVVLHSDSQWESGTVGGTGTLRNEGILNINPFSIITLNGQLENAGTIVRSTMIQGDGMNLGATARIANLPGATFEIWASGTKTAIGGTGLFLNQGKLTSQAFCNH